MLAGARTRRDFCLETPHIEKTFEIFLAGDHAVKEAALGWVYGSETPGMNHLYCFPEELLADSLEEAGFERGRKRGIIFQPSRPALRFRGGKKEQRKSRAERGAPAQAAWKKGWPVSRRAGRRGNGPA